MNRGTIIYDAHCPMCLTVFKLVGGLFARRGFHWLPMQTTGLAGRLGLTEAALHEEMRLELPDGRIAAGVSAWIVLLRSVPWLRPVAFLISRPGFRAVADAAYRWIARNRYCFGGKCAAPPKGNARHHRTIPFLDLP